MTTTLHAGINHPFQAHKFARYAGILTVLMLAESTLAPAIAETAARPRIGLVLGGGGARGTAHIGVLEVLEKLRVPVDCIAGTSMGSLVAGGFVSGLSPQQMTERLSTVDWRDLFEDNPSHAELNYREKRLARSYYPGLEMGLTDKGLQMAHGIVGGQKIKLLFKTLVGADKGERTIESLPLPLSIIATDIGNGERVAFRKGNLSTAMRASMSVPTLLAPVHDEGRRLVDGGLVDNLPVGEVKTLCNADAVIAVDVGSPLLKPDEVNSIFAITGQMINVLSEQNANASRAMLKPGDVHIRPDLQGITAADFDKFREGAARGRAAAEAAAEKLKRYAVPEAQYNAWSNKLKTAQPGPPRIDEIQITGLKLVNPEVVRRHLHVRPGEQLDTAQLERDLGRIYGDGYFESVDYNVLTTRERNILRITPTEKSWGPNYLRFGMDLEASAKENEFALRGAYHKRPINRLGGEWLSGFQIGERATIFTEFYQPVDARQRFFIEPAVGFARDLLSVYQDDHRIAQYEVRERMAFLNLGANVGVFGQVRVGRTARKLDSSIETGSTSLPTGKRHVNGWSSALDFDRFDRTFFPTKGWFARARYFKADDEGYSRLTTDLRAARSWGPYVFNGRFFYVGSPQGRLPVYDAGFLGGFFNLSGYARNQIIAGDIRFASVRGEKVIGKMPLGLAGDLRAGVSLETGNARQRFSETNLAGWQKAASIYLGGETPLGPLFLGYGRASGGHSSLYLFLGFP
jgi:NTE family protein